MGEACRSVAFLRMPTALMDPGWPGEAGLGSGAVGSSGEFSAFTGVGGGRGVQDGEYMYTHS